MSPVLVSLGKDAGDQPVYFPRNFLMDRTAVFSPVASRRYLPMHRTKGTNLLVYLHQLLPERWKRWNSATSRWALRSAPELGNSH
jgi:hypothetical protein